MRVVIDNQLLVAAAVSVSDALAAARLDAQRRGRVVVEAMLDGEPLADDALSNPPTERASAKELRFATADPAELVGSTLRGVAASISDLKSDQSAAAEMLTVGRLGEAMERLGAALKAWESVRDAVIDGTSLMGLSMDAIRVPAPAGKDGTVGGERPLGDQIRSLADCLQEVKRSIGAEDWSGLADVLGYDLQDQADQWKVSLEGLADRVHGGSGRG